VRRTDFRALYEGGRKLDAGRFVLFGRPNDLGHHRLGLTVSRKVGGAVARNRVKRLFREVFRKAAADIPHTFDLVVNARRGCASAAYADLRSEFISAARKVCR
jgi:ribonuclease P protein component